MKLIFTLNGEERSCTIEPDEKLLTTLRNLGTTSPKKGCGEGACGSCAVLLNGTLVNSCITFSATCSGAHVTTVEGLGHPNDPHPIQEEFVKAGAVQCGFCTPGMIMATKALLDSNPDPDRSQIMSALDGNRCRCTGYVKIFEAVGNAAERLSTSKGDGGKP